MKRIILSLSLVALIASTSFAGVSQDGEKKACCKGKKECKDKDKKECKEGDKKECKKGDKKSCCKGKKECKKDSTATK